MEPRGSFRLKRSMLMAALLSTTVLLGSCARGQDYGSEDSSKETFAASAANYDSNASHPFLATVDGQQNESEELTSGYAGYEDGQDSPFKQYHHHLSMQCQACQYRNVYAKASLKSIKAHVLMKLGIEFLPNKTSYPEVPDNIIASFLRPESLHSTWVNHDTVADYVQDEPAEMADEADDDYEYYPITNKIYILPNRK